MSAVNPAVRRQVATRDEGRCIACGTAVVDPDTMQPYATWSIQHRTARGMGGTRNPAINAPANLLVLCGDGVSGCHGYVEHHRTWAQDHGFAVSRYQDPELIPVVHFLYGLAFLTESGWEPIPQGPEGLLTVAQRAADIATARGLDHTGEDYLHIAHVLHETTTTWINDLEAAS